MTLSLPPMRSSPAVRVYTCDHYVVLLYLQLCRATGDPSPASGPPTQTEAKTTGAEQRSVVIVGLHDMLYVGHPLAEDPGIPQSSSQGGNWPGVSTAVLDRLLVPLEERERMSSGVVTKKSSVAHRAVLTARDAALEVRVAVDYLSVLSCDVVLVQEFVVCVEKMVLWSEERGKEEKEREQHWWDHWNHSLTSLTQLYYN